MTLHRYRPEMDFTIVLPGDSIVIDEDWSILDLQDLHGTDEHPILVHPVTLRPVQIGRIRTRQNTEHVHIHGLRRLHVKPAAGCTLSQNIPLAEISGQHNLIEGCTIQSIHDSEGWQQYDWHEQARDGIKLRGWGCKAVNNRIRNVRNCIELYAKNCVAYGNIYHDYSEDGIRPLNHGQNIAYNTGGFVQLGNPDAHRDGMQCWEFHAKSPMLGDLRELAIHHNRFYNPKESPIAQGFGSFEGTVRNSYFADNIIITNHEHGLTLASGINNTIERNIIAHSDPAQKSWLMLGTNKKGLRPCFGNLVQYNLSQRHELDELACHEMSGENRLPDHVLLTILEQQIVDTIQGAGSCV